MKVLYPNRILSVSSTTTAANYTPEAVLNDHPRDVWKGNQDAARLTFDVDAGSNAVAAFNIGGADTIDVRIEDSRGNPLEMHVIHLVEFTTAWEVSTGQGKRYTAFWCDYSYLPFAHKVELVFRGSSAPSCGIVRIGLAQEFQNPHYGLKETWKDNSIRKKALSGHTYITDKPRSRHFAGSFDTTFNTDFIRFMQLYPKVGQHPLAWLIVDNFNNRHFAVFAQFIQGPEGEYKYPNTNIVNFVLEEVA